MTESSLRGLLFLLSLCVLVPASLSAERRSCDAYCSCFTPCAATCYWGSFLSNCGYAGPCTEQCNGLAAQPTGADFTPAAASPGVAWLSALEDARSPRRGDATAAPRAGRPAGRHPETKAKP